MRQQLVLRVSNDFNSATEYEEFIQKIIARHNKARSNRLLEKIKLLKSLPEKRYYAPEILKLAVTNQAPLQYAYH